jgi:hypothetical protein
VRSGSSSGGGNLVMPSALRDCALMMMGMHLLTRSRSLGFIGRCGVGLIGRCGVGGYDR